MAESQDRVGECDIQEDADAAIDVMAAAVRGEALPTVAGIGVQPIFSENILVET